MIISLEAVARRSAMFACAQSVLFFGLFTATWFLDEKFSPNIPWPWFVGISLVMPILLLLKSSPEKTADRLVKYLPPQPPSQQFMNIVDEIAIALIEPVESIQTYASPVANIIML
uniref:hypothetical protein n=1 Tax=Reinekea sp. TaxID=1970455 RepID=UPI002A831859